MLFTSAPFLLYFLPVVLLGYQVLGTISRRWMLGWLALASLFFYAYWNPRFLLVLLISVLVNFAVSRLIASASERLKTFWMIFGVTLDLLALCYFKYLFPFLRFTHDIGWSHHNWTAIVLPLGISFFTFTQIAYLVDLSQGEAAPQNIVEYTLFVTFFPHLIAGPILHHQEMMPQFASEKRYRLNAEDMTIGLSWFILGLAKKAIIADKLAIIADPGFRHFSSLTVSGAWITVLCYSFQLYFDFSGYSDMAIGLARMFSIRFPFNFNSPYKARNIIDFWMRWHMTLTRYLTLYLYNPIALAVRRRRLAAGRKVSNKAQRTLGGFAVMIAWPTILTMFLAGVWHGAGLQFLIFGLLHGLYLTVNHAWRTFRHGPETESKQTVLGICASVLLTYACVLVGQVFFRAESTSAAATLLATLVGVHHASEVYHIPSIAAAVVLLLPVVWFLPNTQEILGQVPESDLHNRWLALFSYRPTWAWSVGMGLMFVLAILFISNSATFLYFQF